MACIDANGFITRTAELVLLALMESRSHEEAAGECGSPLFRIRAIIRELGKLGFISQTDGGFQTNPEGMKAIDGKKERKSVQ